MTYLLRKDVRAVGVVVAKLGFSIWLLLYLVETWQNLWETTLVEWNLNLSLNWGVKTGADPKVRWWRSSGPMDFASMKPRFCMALNLPVATWSWCILMFVLAAHTWALATAIRMDRQERVQEDVKVSAIQQVEKDYNIPAAWHRFDVESVGQFTYNQHMPALSGHRYHQISPPWLSMEYFDIFCTFLYYYPWIIQDPFILGKGQNRDHHGPPRQIRSH